MVVFNIAILDVGRIIPRFKSRELELIKNWVGHIGKCSRDVFNDPTLIKVFRFKIILYL